MLNKFHNYLKIHGDIDSKNTRYNYVNRVKKFLEQYSEFNQTNVDAYLASRIDNKVSKSTFNGDLASLKMYAKFLNKEIKFPKQKFVGKQIRTFITEEELDKILTYCNLLFKKYSFIQFIIKILFYTGIRPDELENLQVQDISFTKPILTIRNPKNKCDRYVPYPLNLQGEIKRFINTEGKAFDVTYDQIKYVFKKLNEMIGLDKHITAYSLRHGYGRYMVRQGYNLKLIQKFMGHSDIKITDIYTDITPEEAIEMFFKKGKKK